MNPFVRPFPVRPCLAALLAMLLGSACTTSIGPVSEFRADSAPQRLHSGDVVKVAFPGSPNLDLTQQIRRDGKINLYMIGEVQAANRTPAELQRELMERYSTQLVSNEVNVTLVSSSFSIFVGGAVIRPGKIQPDRALTALEAVMEAGGFINDKADAKSVVVIRQEDGRTRRFTLNLKAVLDGTTTEPFFLRSYDIVYVPERFSWF